MGRKSLEEVEQKLIAMGLKLGHVVDPRKRCELLKQIRKEIAVTNGIVYLTSECSNKGECLGTCPWIEAEIRYLDAELNNYIRSGGIFTLSKLSLANFFHSNKYEGVLPFNDKLACVKMNGKWGLIDKTGKLVKPCEYDKVYIENQHANMKKGKECFVFDSQGILEDEDLTVVFKDDLEEIEEENIDWESAFVTDIDKDMDFDF